MRFALFAAALCCTSSAFAQERTYNFQGYTLNEANVIARALEAGTLRETAGVYFKMQRQISEQDQAAAQSTRDAFEQSVRKKIESEPSKPESPQ
jgi:hypothetical protein